MSQFWKMICWKVRLKKVAEVFEPQVLKTKGGKMKEWFAIIMGASLLVLMVPIFIES